MRTKYFILFAVVMIPLFLLRDFTPDNELRYLSIADEALRNGTFFTFYNHGLAYADKPPLYLWIVMAGRLLFGTHSMVTQQTLCGLTKKDKPNVTRLIDRLEHKQLVQRITDAEDKRKKRICITDQGVHMYEKVTRIVGDMLNHGFSSVIKQDSITIYNQNSAIDKYYIYVLGGLKGFPKKHTGY